MHWLDITYKQHQTFLILGDDTYTYQAIFSAGDDLFSGCERGLIAIICQRDVATITAYVGALRCGLVPLLLPRDINDEVLSELLGAYQPRYLFGQDIHLVNYQAKADCFSGKLYETNTPQVQKIHADLALLIPTSGSTGDPKCVRLSLAQLHACTKSIVTYLGLDAATISMTSLPLNYAYGLSILHNCLYTRSQLVISGEQSWLERSFWDLVETHQVTDLAGVPLMFEMIKRLRLSDRICHHLKRVTQAGGWMKPALTKHFVDYFSEHDIQYFTMYGQTEAAPRISYMPPEKAIEKLGSAGIPIPGGRVSLKDPDAAGVGELVYHGENVCLGYAENIIDCQLGDVFVGTLYTGDLAEIDEEGFITIVGRKKRFIKLHGLSVNLDHIERIITASFGACAVIGKDDALRVFVPMACVDDVSSHIKERFGFHPTSYKVMACADIPTQPSGKIDYQQLYKDCFGERVH